MKLQLCTAALSHYPASASAADNKLLFLARDINDRKAFEMRIHFNEIFSDGTQTNEVNDSLS